MMELLILPLQMGKGKATIDLEPGRPQLYTNDSSVTVCPALLIHHYLYRQHEPLKDINSLQHQEIGWVVEMADQTQYKTFEEFQNHILNTKIQPLSQGWVYHSGKDCLEGTWSTFLVNGINPFNQLNEKALWQDTPLSQMGQGRLEKDGAVVERTREGDKFSMFLFRFPKQQRTVVVNPIPNYQKFSLRTPDGAELFPDGLCSMGFWSIRGRDRIEIRYIPWNPEKRISNQSLAACSVWITGIPTRPTVILNGKDITSQIKPYSQKQKQGWLIPLIDHKLSDEEIQKRLALTHGW